MANTEHLEILKSGVKSWNKWRIKKRVVTLDLSGADLRDADLRDADLSGADLNGADLRIADLNRANLHGANLRDANLRDANLSGADLRDANLRDTDLNRANLRGANLRDANLSGANLRDANLNRAHLNTANLKYTNLNAVNLSGAYLNAANLSTANLHGANLSTASLIGANLSGADLSDANLSAANLSAANLSEVRLDQTVFGLTDLSSCKHLESVKVSGPCIIDFPTLRASKNLPKAFLTKLGIPDLLMEYLPDFYDPALRIYPAFLSHSWADKEFVRKLYEALTKKGVTIWLDEKKMKPGDNIHDSIGDAIKYYDKLILICSENVLNSWWVEKELERVFEKERELQKERGKKFRLVIPIRIDDSILNWKDGVAATVKSSVIGDFTKWQDEAEFEKAVKELVDALNAGRLDIRPPSFL